MKNKILALLAVAAVGSFAAAQQASTAVSTTVADANAISVNNSTLTLTLGEASPSTLTYSSNDGDEHDITAASTAWAGPGTVFPTLSANGSSLRDSANAAPGGAPILVRAAANTSSTFDVNLLATNVSGAGLQAGDYTATVTYTLN